MDELDIGKSIENQADIEERQEIKENLEQDYGSSGDGRNIFIAIALILGVFVASFGGFKAYDHFTAASVINIDDMHEQNLEGELDDEEGYVYNGFSFIKADGLWWTEVSLDNKLVKIPLHFAPKEVEHVKISGSLDPAFNVGEKVYLSIDPNVRDKYYTLALSELSFNVAKGLDRLPEGSCTEENWACENRTIISCENNPNNLPVIELDLEEGEEGIDIIGSCIKVKGNSYGLVKAVNRLLYQWYEVMEI